MEATLQRREREVEAARARFASDLQILRQPETVQSFTRAVKIELMTARDAAIESAKTSALSAINDAVDKLKNKAAANPAALLAIGAGLAWHFVKNPPVVSALVGAGLFSLLRTQAPAFGPDTDLVAEGRERLKEQVGELADMAKATAQSASQAALQGFSEARQAGVEMVSDVAGTVTRQVQEAQAQVRDQVRDQIAKSAEQLTEQFSQAASRGADAAGEVVATGRRLQHDVVDALREGAGATVAMTTDAVRSATNGGAAGERGDGAPTLVRQDTILLGIAGVAVAAALGIALHRSANET